MNFLGEQLERYVYEHTTAESELFAELRRETQASLPDAGMQVGRVEGQFLRMLVQISGATRLLEVGTFSGFSGLALASGLRYGGRLITCEIDRNAAAMARRYFDRSPWGEKIQICLGPALPTLQNLSANGARFDLAFIDADKENYVAYWDAIVPMIEVGGLILGDNALWGGAVTNPQTPADHGVVAFNKRVAEDDRVEQVLLGIRDGVMMARKKGPRPG